VRTVHTGPLMGLMAQLVLLVALAWTVGLSGPGWVVGIACGVITSALLVRGLASHGADRLGPADWVTWTRATLAGGVAALTADSFGGPISVATLVGLAMVALALDGVDGWVARRTDTESALGARLDMEVDAFLMLVLSVYVARSLGGWVLAIGAARYAFGFAGWLLPWMRVTLPPRYWRKVVAATQGVALTFAAADVVPHPVTDAVLVASLALLAESFGRDVWWLWRRRRVEPEGRPQGDGAPEPAGRRGAVRSTASAGLTVLACLLVWIALVAPNEIRRLTPGAFVRIPLEGLLVVAVVLVLPPRARRLVAALVGVILGPLTIVKILDMGFFEALGRPFNPADDWGYFGSAVGLLRDSIGRTAANLSLVGAGVLVVVVLVGTPLSVLRLTRLVDRHRTTSIRAVTALGVVWILCAAFGLQMVTGAPIASTSAARLAYDQVGQVRTAMHAQQAFERAAAVDAFRDAPGDDLLTGLRGKDVILAFVESYGRVAVQGSAFSPKVDAVLDAGTKKLSAAGFSAKSAFLTSSTFGGISWLAHSTLQTGLWIDTQQRYNKVVKSDRFTLSDAFKRAGWRTVADVPSNGPNWPQGTSFYHYDQLYNAQNVGYLGPSFSYANMPDQYTLSAFHRLELAKPDHAPVMAEIDFVSSHTPWAPLPHMIDWSDVGDGSVFEGMPEQGQTPDTVWRAASHVRAAYGQSIRYSMNALVSFVQTYADPNLVLVVLGDHQPATVVSGYGAGHDVPISIIAHDPAVLDSISGWRWQDGLRPHPDAPVWRMDTFRDRFLTAYGPQPSAAASPAQH
jgi:phosphatidylglycerophosphate synthase